MKAYLSVGVNIGAGVIEEAIEYLPVTAHNLRRASCCHTAGSLECMNRVDILRGLISMRFRVLTYEAHLAIVHTSGCFNQFEYVLPRNTLRGKEIGAGIFNEVHPVE